jgi:hypothetical protein
MKKSSKALFISLAIVLSVFLSTASAHDKDHGNGKGRDKHAEHERDGDHDRANDRDGHGPSKRPAGWDKGKKTGWGNCDVPPGQAKKVGCNPGTSGHHADHVRHTDHDARLHHEAHRGTAAHETNHAHPASHRDTHHDVAKNQAAHVKGGSRVEHPPATAVQK